MAQMLDDEVELNEIEAVEQQAAPEPEEVKPELPEKFRNKSVEDIVQMYQEAEKTIGRQAQEVGEVRKLADELLKQQLKPKEREEVPEVDFFENPQEAINHAVANNPKVRAAEEQLLQIHRAQAAQQLAAKHPDYAQVAQSEDFANWVKASKVRQNLYAQADAFDYDAADELLSTYKQLRTVQVQQVDEGEKQARKQALKSASVDTGGSGESSRKTYRRSELMKMMLNDRASYQELADSGELARAYSEGRVR